jgi:hypothetical protein
MMRTNFEDPAFDLAENKFVNARGRQVQFGAGVIGSLFDNCNSATAGTLMHPPREPA